MINSYKAIAANTDLASAQAFLFRNAAHNIALIISAAAEDVFLSIKQAVNQTENIIHDETDSLPDKLAKIHHHLASQLVGVSGLQVMVVAWSDDILYIQSRGHYYAVLYRGKDLINLVTPSQEDQLISGHILPGDKVLFGTQSLVGLLGEIKSRNPELESILRYPPANFQDAIDLLIAGRRSPDPLAPVAAILLEVPIPPEPVTPPISVSLGDAPRQSSTAKFRPKFNLPRPHFKLPPLGFRRLARRAPIVGNFRLYALIAIIVLVIGGGLGIFKLVKSRSNAAQVAPLVTQAQTKYNTAQALKDLNSAEAKANLLDAQNLIAQALRLNPNDQSAKYLQSQITQNKGAILRQVEFTDWPVFLSLDLIKSGFQATTMDAYGKYLLLMDPTSKTLVLLDKDQKSNQILAGSRQMGNAEFASINSKLAFAFSEDKGVTMIDTQNQADTPIIKADPDWGKIKDITAFGGNVYLLDSIKNQIWKYVPAAAGYSEKVPYLKGTADLQNSSRMHIDSSVWVLQNDEIHRFTSGVEDFFSPSGLDEPIKSISTFFVSDETDSLYLLDPQNSRLLVFDKTGQYQAQYIGDKFATATDLAVDETAKKIYLLEGNKLYQLDLK